MVVLDSFTRPCAAWFAEHFDGPTPVQEQGWNQIAQGSHALLLAPTGSGKTLAAFFWAIDRLMRLPVDAPPGVRVLYISPLKALVHDIERNLRAPLVGSRLAAERLGLPVRPCRVDMRTGDTSARDRAQQRRDPGEILITTPESLYLMLGSQAAAGLSQVHTVIVDEIHALAPTKRGAHLALSLERLSALCATDPQRIGLSATVRPPGEAARFLGGDRPVAIVDCSARAYVSLNICVPVPDMERPPEVLPKPQPAPAGGAILGQLARDAMEAAPVPPRPSRDTQGMWASIYPQILERLAAGRATLVFVNSRSLCERMAQQLNDLAGQDWVRAHHGSLSLARRTEIEEALKDGSLKGIVATSSLELGIDMGHIDLVILVESPGSVARGLQRVGRAGHSVGAMSHGLIFPKFRGDLLECAVIGERMRAGELEPVTVPVNALDVLSQQIVAIVAQTPIRVDTLHDLLRRAYPYARLSREALTGVLDMLSGAYPSDVFSELRPLLSWDRSQDVVTPRGSAKLTATLNAGTIPDRGSFAVYLVGDGPRLGELDEEMVHESRRGDCFLLGASTWRIQEITRDRVLVTPAPGEPGKMPFWRGDGPGRPIELGRALGAFTRRLGNMDPTARQAHCEADLGLNAYAAANLSAYIEDQRTATGTLPSDLAITVERFRDEMGDWRLCLLSPFGARVHAPWALALEATLSERAGLRVQVTYTDDGIMLRVPEGRELPALDDLLPDADQVEELVMQSLGQSALFAGHFRENAGRALLLPRRRAQGRSPLWQQRLRAKSLLAAASRYPSFPIVLETYRQCLRDVFDLPALSLLLQQIRRREVSLDEVETSSPSPFARSLAFAYVAAYLYEQDAPLAERRAQALTLDRDLLQELLGEVSLSTLLDGGAIDDLEAQLQGLATGHQARGPDELHDLLRRVGELTLEEMGLRVQPEGAAAVNALNATADDDGDALDADADTHSHGAEPPDAPTEPSAAPSASPDACQAAASTWAQALVDQRRAVWLTRARVRRLAAIDDVALLRDALGVAPPSGLPDRVLHTLPNALSSLIVRYARSHGPFTAQTFIDTYGVSLAQLQAPLAELQRADVLTRGAMRPGGSDDEWCDVAVLRRIKRASLAALRHQVAAVDEAALGRFLPGWHGLDRPRRGEAALEEAIAQLAGLPLSFQALRHDILPARVSDFSIDMLDMLCATGSVLWMGCGALGPHDGRVLLLPRELAPLYVAAPPDYVAPGPLHAAILARLTQRGACFTTELVQATQDFGKTHDVEAALFDLVWAGQITNDTLAPLRALGNRGGPRRGQVGPKRRAGGAGGRWSRVADFIDTSLSPTERAHARATSLLERYGVVSREAAAAEDLAGGFSSVYGVLRAMEASGKVRRGHFVAGLTGAQFAYAGAIERLRGAHDADRGQRPPTTCVAALDPANPYGALLPWPKRLDEAASRKPRRVPGAYVVLAGGRPLAYLEPKGHGLLLFAAMRTVQDAGHCLVEALRPQARAARGNALQIRTLDGEPALAHPAAAALMQAGMAHTYEGLTLEGLVR